MKQLFQFSLLLLALLISATAAAHDFEVNGIYYLKNGTKATVTYKGSNPFEYSNWYTGNVTIPPTVTYSGITYSVTSIGKNAFDNCTGVTKVTIPNSVTSIGNYAFAGCNSLTSVNVPNSVTTIGEYAFGGCNFSSITIPNSVTSIGIGAFSDCTGLTNLTIPNSITTISKFTFSGCEGLTSINIPNSVTSIGDYAFDSCTGATSLTIPKSVNAIGSCSFIRCDGITDLIWNARACSTTGLWDASNIERVTIGNEVVTLPQGFVFGSKITSVTLPNSLTSISELAFGNCTSLTSIVIPGSVSAIGNHAFSGCSGLANVNISNSVTSIGDDAFYCCTSLTSVTIPNSVISIGRYAFSSCHALSGIVIGTNVASIGNLAFSSCWALDNVKCLGTMPPVMANSNCFDSSCYNRATLLVPSESVEIYQTTDYWYKFVHINMLPTLNDALNCNGGHINFTSTGTYPWAVIDDGSRIYAQSGNGGVPDSSSKLTATVSTPQGGTLSFDYKAWGEDDYYDVCTFSIDGTVQFEYDNLENDWRTYTVHLTSGTHTLTWTYSKDGSVDPRGDFFAIDNVNLVLPVIRGDVNGDGNITISDVTNLIDILLSGGDIPAGADVNGDGDVSIKDVTDLIDILLSGY